MERVVVRQVDFVRSAAKKWRELKANVVTRINLNVYDQIERSTLDQIKDIYIYIKDIFRMNLDVFN